MKNTTLLISFVLFAVFTNAKSDTKTYKNEIGLSFLNANKTYDRESPIGIHIPFTRPMRFSQGENEKPKSANILPELYFNTSINNYLKFRTSISYTRLTFENNSGFNAYNRSYYQFYIAQGLQIDMFKKRRIIPYVGMDIMLHHQWQKSNQPANTIGSWPIYDELNIAQTFVDGRLLAGVRYKFAQRFSLSLESAAAFRVAAFPISRLSINYHF